MPKKTDDITLVAERTVRRRDAIAGYQDPQVRAEKEAKRGIVRDAQGKIVRSKEWLEARIETLQSRLWDCENRAKNVKVEIEQRKKELKDVG